MGVDAVVGDGITVFVGHSGQCADVLCCRHTQTPPSSACLCARLAVGATAGVVFGQFGVASDSLGCEMCWWCPCGCVVWAWF